MKSRTKYVGQLVCIGMIGMMCLQSSVAFAAGPVTASGTYLMRDGEHFRVKGMNYYPKDFAWKMWENYWTILPQIDSELDIASSLGVNTVRFFIPYENPRIDCINDFIRRLKSRNMLALPTLFDLMGTSSIPYTDYTQSKAYLTTLVAQVGNVDPAAIVAWDLKNELDRDYNKPGYDDVKAWAREMLTYLKQQDPQHLRTIGFKASPDDVSYNAAIPAEFAANVDVVSMHYFLSERQFETDVTTLLGQIGSKPLILEEFGLHSMISYAANPHDEDDQAAYMNALLALSEANDIAGYLFWTLNDFSYIFTGIEASHHCQGILRNSQYNGCEKTTSADYTRKPAADIIQRHYNGQILYIDEANGWVDGPSDSPVYSPPPTGWTHNYVYSPKTGAILRGYNPDPTQLHWSHTIGNFAISQWTDVVNQIGWAKSPMLKNVNVTKYPILQIRVTHYETHGSNATLRIGVKKGGVSTQLFSVTPTTQLPTILSFNLQQAPLNWSGNQDEFQIILELVPETGRNGYSATYEIDWIAITTCPDCSYLLWTK